MGRVWTVALAAVALAAVALAGWCACAASAQPPVWSVTSYGTYPAGVPATGAGWMGVFPVSPPTGNRPPLLPDTSSSAPLARVVRNPDASNGSPPYALTDHAGTIQRYVEPVPGIDLEPYIGGVVRVRHDTGRTLLASQLELPSHPLRPLVGDSDEGQWQASTTPAARLSIAARPAHNIQRTEYVDDDDGTVQLLAEGEEALSDGQVTMDMPGESIQSDAGYPMSLDGMPMEGGPMYGEPMDMSGMPMESGDPMGVPMDGMGYGDGMPAGMPMCPQCGGYRVPPDYAGMPGVMPGPTCQCDAERCRYYAEVQINFLRTHVLESFAGGKLSEKYEFSPRVILGFDGIGQVDGRARYWHYGRNTPFLDESGTIRVDFDVFDFEATRAIELEKSELLLAAGVRTANIKLDDDDGDTASSSLLGLTMAADFETLICQLQRGRITGACGARLSLLGGDWGQDDGHDIVPVRLRDDNVVVDELYAGVGYETCCRKMDLHAQLGFEMQNWHSDALSQFAGGDSIGFIGPGIEIGAEF